MNNIKNLCNRSGSSSSDQSHWSSSGSGGRSRVPPIPPWPAVGGRAASCATWPRGELQADGALPCWLSRPLQHSVSGTPAKRKACHNNRPSVINYTANSTTAAATATTTTTTSNATAKSKRKEKQRHSSKNAEVCGDGVASSTATSLLRTFKSTGCEESNGRKTEDNPSLSDMDNGNEKSSASSARSSCRSRNSTAPAAAAAAVKRPVFTKTQEVSQTLSLLQIYMRQKSQTSLHQDTRIKDVNQDMIASGGGEGWVEDYPSSADEKLGLESISSSLLDDAGNADDVDDVEEEEEEEDDDDPEDDRQQARSLTLTDISDMEPTSIQIDALPFNTQQDAGGSSDPDVSLATIDKLIAKIKPFELGLSPASMEEHCHFENCLRRTTSKLTSQQDQQDQSCQTTSSSSKEESTSTDPVKPLVYVLFPSYSLPDLSFLKKYDYTWISDALLSPQDISMTRDVTDIPVNVDELKKRNVADIKDWQSLKLLLPEEIRKLIADLKQQQHQQQQRKPRPKSCDSATLLQRMSQRSSGYRGSSTWTESTMTLATVPQSPPMQASPDRETPPPLPKRTASLPCKERAKKSPEKKKKSSPARNRTNNDPLPPRPPLPMYQEIGDTLAEAELQLKAMAGMRRNTTTAHNRPAALKLRSKTLYHTPTYLPEDGVSAMQRNGGCSSSGCGGSDDGGQPRPFTTNTLRKTVSFGEHLSGAFLDTNVKRRPLSASHVHDPQLDDPALLRKRGSHPIPLCSNIFISTTSKTFNVNS